MREEKYPLRRGKEEVERYLDKRRADRLAAGSVRKVWFYLKLGLWFIDKEPTDITLQDIEAWRYEMTVVRNYEPETVWAAIITLRKFLRFLGRKDIADAIELPKRPRQVPPEKEIWLLPEEQERMVRKSMEMGIREYAMIKLMLSSGIRRKELVDLEVEDVDLDKLRAHVRHGKGDKARIVCFDHETRDALVEWLKLRQEPRDGCHALFLSKFRTRISSHWVAEQVKECAVLAGIRKNITPHKLRHTFITNVIERTKDIPLAQKLAGHSEIKTTMRYHHSTQEEVFSKYREYLDTPTPGNEPNPYENLPAPQKVLRALDAKFLKGELPFAVYSKLRDEYERMRGAGGKVQRDQIDVAYR
ncbi:MAG: tyrosine-type recombinase/integrase [Euryarchaeota archaeon]|nr:tyrosine-type recombinase/integrase [Euryarchaeota archaeon]